MPTRDVFLTASARAYQKHVLHGQETVSIFIANLHAILTIFYAKTWDSPLLRITTVSESIDGVSQSVSGTLDRPWVVASSKTCGHVRSSRRRWRSAQCRPRSGAPTFGRVVLAGASTPA